MQELYVQCGTIFFYFKSANKVDGFAPGVFSITAVN